MIRNNAESLARENGIEFTHIQNSKIRKETIVRKIIDKRGGEPGLVAILSAMEACPNFRPWHDKKTHRTFLKYTQGRCLHYYFYFILEDLGLCYLRVPTWAPFRLQFYFNGHNWLASELRKANNHYEMFDNAFVKINDFEKAQTLVDNFDINHLRERLDQLARRCCPVFDEFPQGYHWSLMQVEYATDIVFKKQSDLEPLYEMIVRTAVHAVKPDHVATFLGRKLTANFRDEIGNDIHTRIEGTCIKHHMGKVAIKMYDKFHLVLRVETTVNDVKYFKQFRTVRHRDGTDDMRTAPMKKHIYSLTPLSKLLLAANNRYLEFVAAIDDPTVNINNLNRVTESKRKTAVGMVDLTFSPRRTVNCFEPFLMAVIA